MAVWLKARAAQKKLRDGNSRGDPMRTVGDAPVFFAKRSPEEFEHSPDFVVVPATQAQLSAGRAQHEDALKADLDEAAEEVVRLVGRVRELEQVVQLSRGAEEEARQKAADAEERVKALEAELSTALEQLGAQAAQIEQLGAVAGEPEPSEEPKARRASGRKG